MRIFLQIAAWLVLAMQPIHADRSVEMQVKQETEHFMREQAIPGAAIAIFFEGKEYYIQLGYSDRAKQKQITPDTLFQIGSITKVFTSTLIALEVLQHKISLLDPISKFLPGVQIRENGLAQITIKDLATHSSSLPRMPPPLPRNGNYSQDQLISFLSQWQPSYPIGSRYLYSNIGFALLGYAAGNVEKMDYFQALKKFVLDPLGMYSTVVYVPQSWQEKFAQGYNKTGNSVKQVPPQVWPGGGALRSSTRDMMKFLRANLDVSGPLDIRKAMQLAQEGVFTVNDHLILGLGWQRVPISGKLLIEKNGGVEGFSSYIGMTADKKAGIVILFNKGKSGVTELGRKILVEL